MIKEKPNTTAKEMAVFLNITEEGIRYHLKKLIKAGEIMFVGPAKGGHWEINETNQ